MATGGSVTAEGAGGWMGESLCAGQSDGIRMVGEEEGGGDRDGCDHQGLSHADHRRRVTNRRRRHEKTGRSEGRSAREAEA